MGIKPWDKILSSRLTRYFPFTLRYEVCHYIDHGLALKAASVSLPIEQVSVTSFVVPHQQVGGVHATGTIEQHKQWGRAAFARMQHDDLAFSPENYALFFAYCSGRIPDLNMSIDELSKRFGKLSQEQCSDLYIAHVGVEAERRALQKANSIFEMEIAKVLELLDQSTRGTGKFTETLNTLNGQLAMPPELNRLKEVVGRVAQETRLIADQNVRLQQQLTQSTQQVSELRYNLDVVKQESLTDSLTGVGNRKFFQYEIERLMQEAQEVNLPMSLLMVDIDFFKKFNDQFGHLIGDQVLKLVGKTLMENVKGRDVVTRYGGEEFAILLPQTAQDSALHLADQLRNAVGTRKITKKNSTESLGTITLSIGVSQLRAGDLPAQLIERADQALYQAKNAGRNRVMMFKD
jgi:diguanylate cyclase